MWRDGGGTVDTSSVNIDYLLISISNEVLGNASGIVTYMTCINVFDGSYR